MGVSEAGCSFGHGLASVLWGDTIRISDATLLPEKP
jgi:hypothetical protein